MDTQRMRPAGADQERESEKEEDRKQDVFQTNRTEIKAVQPPPLHETHQFKLINQPWRRRGQSSQHHIHTQTLQITAINKDSPYKQL